MNLEDKLKNHQNQILDKINSFEYKQNSNPNKKDLIIFVHPFFAQFSPIPLNESEHIEESIQYTDRLFSFLENENLHIKYSTLLIEDPNMIKHSNPLAENKIFDKTLISKPSSGILQPQDIKDFEQFTYQKEILICGQYNSRCVKQVIDQLEGNNHQGLNAILDLVLNPPCTNLTPKVVYKTMNQTFSNPVLSNELIQTIK